MKAKGVLLVVLITTLPIFLLLTSIDIVTSDLSFFEKKYDEYDRYERTGINRDNLMDITKKLLNYIKGKSDNIHIHTEINGKNKQVFMQREILHLKDVRDLFEKGFLIRNICGILALLTIIILFKISRSTLWKSLIVSCLIPIGIIVILSIPLLTSFYDSFTVFHKILFSNDLWLLDPKTEVLIQMYPLDFFKSIALRIFIIYIIEVLAILVTGIISLRFLRMKKLA